MSDLDESIGKILLELQRDDPETFGKLLKKAQKENPELFEGADVTEGANGENREQCSQ